MIQAVLQKNSYQAHFERLEQGATDKGPPWLMPLRRAAMARFTELGFPSSRQEEWRHTDVSPIANTCYCEGKSVPADVEMHQLEPFLFGGADVHLCVFVNGHFAPGLSSLTRLPSGVRVGSLAEALMKDASLIEPHLARHASFEDEPFAALNTALMEDGAFVHVPAGTVVESPIHLLFISTQAFEPFVSHPRNLIVAEHNSQVTMVESYVSLAKSVYFSNVVTEIVAQENTVVDHYKVTRESDEAFHVATLQLHQHRSSNLTSHNVSLGGSLVRHNVNTVLDGDGCECTLNGLYLVDGTRHVDNHLVVDHAKPHCNSREFYVGVLDGRSKGIFSGRIIVRKDAQKTDGKQTNRCLLLSEDAQVESKPQLEILADDVKCTHGATIGQIDEEAVFYLRSRGLDERAARSMLIFAFAKESIQNMRTKSLRAQIDLLVLDRLAQGALQEKKR